MPAMFTVDLYSERGLVLELLELSTLIAKITAVAKPEGGNPNFWCICTCSASGCNQLCFGNGGHRNMCRCINH